MNKLKYLLLLALLLIDVSPHGRRDPKDNFFDGCMNGAGTVEMSVMGNFFQNDTIKLCNKLNVLLQREE